MKDTKAVTVYFPLGLIEEMRNEKSMNSRIIELVQKGLRHEKHEDKVGMYEAIKYLYDAYNNKHPNTPIK